MSENSSKFTKDGASVPQLQKVTSKSQQCQGKESQFHAASIPPLQSFEIIQGAAMVPPMQCAETTLGQKGAPIPAMQPASPSQGNQQTQGTQTTNSEGKK